MKHYDKYKRLTKIIFAAMVLILTTAIYSWVWMNHYNSIILSPFFRKGNWMMICLYMVLLTFFLHTYGGFKIGYFKKVNLLYSQILAIFFTNTFTYFQVCVLSKYFINPSLHIKMTIVEVIVLTLWTLFFYRIYSAVFPPRKILLISGDLSDYHLLEKMNSREDKYEICEVMNYKQNMEELMKKAEFYGTVMIGDIPSHERNCILKYCFSHSIRTYSIPKISDILIRSCVEFNMFDSPLLLSRNEEAGIDQQISKRVFDIIGSFFCLIIFLPLMAVIAVCIKISDGGSIFYKQKRLTRGGKVFEIYKFRTMIQNAEKNGIPRLATKDDERILPFGRLLRRSHLDELPQMINVLQGDMSLVGPRPERPELTEQFAKEIPDFPMRLMVKAGLTGYAQVYGKYSMTAYDKLKLDLIYIRSCSVLLDIKLLMMTFKIFCMKENSEGVDN